MFVAQLLNSYCLISYTHVVLRRRVPVEGFSILWSSVFITWWPTSFKVFNYTRI